MILCETVSPLKKDLSTCLNDALILWTTGDKFGMCKSKRPGHDWSANCSRNEQFVRNKNDSRFFSVNIHHEGDDKWMQRWLQVTTRWYRDYKSTLFILIAAILQELWCPTESIFRCIDCTSIRESIRDRCEIDAKTALLRFDNFGGAIQRHSEHVSNLLNRSLNRSWQKTVWMRQAISLLK